MYSLQRRSAKLIQEQNTVSLFIKRSKGSMGSECSLNKRCYDINMSKRTRKPFYYNAYDQTTCVDMDFYRGGENIPARDLDRDGGDQSSPSEVYQDGAGEKNDDDRKSLKKLMINIDGDEKADVNISKSSDEQGSRGRSSLGQHFTEEEKNLQLVKKHQKVEGLQGLKLKKLVSRCAKVLSHLVKVKREPGKAVLRLTM